jgi:hypothetical protein
MTASNTLETPPTLEQLKPALNKTKLDNVGTRNTGDQSTVNDQLHQQSK